MKEYKSLFIITCILVANYTANGQDLLRLAQEEIDKYERVSYKQKAFYPNPVGRIDTVNVTANFQKSKSSLLKYDFIIEKDFFNSDVVYIDGRFRSVKHSDETIVFYPENDPGDLMYLIETLPDVEYSPVTLLNRSDWEFVRDTLVNGQSLKGYFRVENDEIRNGNTVYTEQHIFLNPDSKRLERWERRNYYNGSLQKVVYTYWDYSLSNSGASLSYELPSNYRSELYGKAKDSRMLKAGQEAPVFSGSDLQGSSIDLEDYRGKKVLLNFSSIGCPHSQDALRYMDKEGFQLAGNITPLFLSIWDRKEDVVEYFKQINGPLTVILDTEEVSEMYGVSGTPTFILIDEKGNIEKVAEGFDKEFLNSLKAGS